MDITLIGIDIAKNVFQLAYANKKGRIVKRRRLSREKLLQEIAQQPACTIAMEACGSANYWAREFNCLDIARGMNPRARSRGNSSPLTNPHYYCARGKPRGINFKKLHHEVKLIASQHVKPYVRGNKNDYRDSEAIVEAATRPQMPFVTPKTIEQQEMKQ